MNRELPADFDVDYQVTRLVRKVRVRTIGRLAEIHEDLDYNSLVMFIAIADVPEGVRAADLADALHVHKSTISRAVAALERMSLVRRSPDPDDGRAQVITADPAGRERLEAYRRQSHEWLAQLLSDWEPDELRTFAALLGRLNDAADQTD